MPFQLQMHEENHKIYNSLCWVYSIEPCYQKMLERTISRLLLASLGNVTQMNKLDLAENYYEVVKKSWAMTIYQWMMKDKLFFTHDNCKKIVKAYHTRYHN